MTISIEEKFQKEKDELSHMLKDSTINTKKFNDFNGISNNHLKKNDRDEIVEREDNSNGVMVKKEAIQLFKEKNIEAAYLRFKNSLQFLMVGSKNYSTVKDQYKDDVLEVLDYLVQCALMMDQWKKARDYSTDILDMDRNNIKALKHRSTANKHLDDIDESILDLERALELDPSNKKFKQTLKSLKKANDM